MSGPLEGIPFKGSLFVAHDADAGVAVVGMTVAKRDLEAQLAAAPPGAEALVILQRYTAEFVEAAAAVLLEGGLST